MSLDSVFAKLPDPGSYSLPDYSLPAGDPVVPVALTADELSTLLDLFERFAAVDPTGLDSNPFLRATTEFFEQTFGAPVQRPDERLHDDIAAMLNDFSDDLGGRELGVVDATPAHHRTLYLFLVSCKGYHVAPHLDFRPTAGSVETLYAVYERVTEQDVYLKRPKTVLE
jgi:hypothetical protein